MMGWTGRSCSVTTEDEYFVGLPCEGSMIPCIEGAGRVGYSKFSKQKGQVEASAYPEAGVKG